jgi:hypothetical protein
LRGLQCSHTAASAAALYLLLLLALAAACSEELVQNIKSFLKKVYGA